MSKSKSERRRISVAIAAYNGTRFLRQQLDSILSQSEPVQQIVVSDDRSTDQTRQLLEEYKSRFPDVMLLLFQENNIGVLTNFFEAFKACAGDIIFYCDQDDIWLPNKVKMVTSKLSSPSLALVSHTSFVVNENLIGNQRIPARTKFGSHSFPYNPKRFVCHGHQVAFRSDVRDIIIKLHPFAAQIAPALACNLDRFIPFCASLVGGAFAMPDALVRFRRHPSSVSPLGKASSGGEASQSVMIDRINREFDEHLLFMKLVECAQSENLISSDQSRRLINAYDNYLQLIQIVRDQKASPYLAMSLMNAALRRANSVKFANTSTVVEVLRLLYHAVRR